MPLGPWSGKITINVKEVSAAATKVYLRIPGWCKKYTLKQNGKTVIAKNENGFVPVTVKATDKLELDLDMPATLIESNPLVEETKNRVAVKRGPIVYCLESADLPGQPVFDVSLPATIKLQPVPMQIAGGNVMALTGQAQGSEPTDWKNTLYKELTTKRKPVTVKLIPYYAWANRGKTDMTVWLNVLR